MKKRYFLLLMVLFLIGLGLVLGWKFNSSTAYSSPTALLDTYFSSAIQQDYATTYTCYYQEYQKKVSRAEFIKRRKEASILQDYEVISLKQDGNSAQAEVLLTFAPSKKLPRNTPVTVPVKEELTKENNQWKVKVW